MLEPAEQLKAATYYLYTSWNVQIDLYHLCEAYFV